MIIIAWQSIDHYTDTFCAGCRNAGDVAAVREAAAAWAGVALWWEEFAIEVYVIPATSIT